MVLGSKIRFCSKLRTPCFEVTCASLSLQREECGVHKTRSRVRFCRTSANDLGVSSRRSAITASHEDLRVNPHTPARATTPISCGLCNPKHICTEFISFSNFAVSNRSPHIAKSKQQPPQVTDHCTEVHHEAGGLRPVNHAVVVSEIERQ